MRGISGAPTLSNPNSNLHISCLAFACAAHPHLRPTSGMRISHEFCPLVGCVCAQEASSTWPCPSQSASSVWVVLKVRPAPLVLLGCPLCVSPALLTGVPVRRRAVRESPSNANVSDHSLRCWYFRVVNSLIAPAFYVELLCRVSLSAWSHSA